jgi:hypothetical protein
MCVMPLVATAPEFAIPLADSGDEATLRSLTNSLRQDAA